MLTNLHALLPRHLGGHRAIAIAATFYRLLMGLSSPDLQEWNESVILKATGDGTTDTAGPCMLSGDHAIARQMTMEASAVLSKPAAQLLWDLEACFDTIDWSSLVKLAKATEYRLRLLVLASMAHLAPRTIKAKQSLPPWGGCRQAIGNDINTVGPGFNGGGNSVF